MDELQLDDYEVQLLSAWEEIAKRGQLTTWIFLSLKDGPKHMANIKAFIDTNTHGVIGADDQSMYRALRRFSDTGMVGFRTVPGDGGGERKVYSLTSIGSHVLEAFLERTIRNLYYQDSVKALINKEPA